MNAVRRHLEVAGQAPAYTPQAIRSINVASLTASLSSCGGRLTSTPDVINAGHEKGGTRIWILLVKHAEKGKIRFSIHPLLVTNLHMTKFHVMTSIL